MEAHTEPEHKRCWQAAGLGSQVQRGNIPIPVAVYRNATKGTGLRIMPRDQGNRKRFAHPMFPKTYLNIDEPTMTIEITADSMSYVEQFASDLGLPSYHRD